MVQRVNVTILVVSKKLILKALSFVQVSIPIPIPTFPFHIDPVPFHVLGWCTYYTGKGMCCDGMCICDEDTNGYEYRSDSSDNTDCDCEPAEVICLAVSHG